MSRYLINLLLYITLEIADAEMVIYCTVGSPQLSLRSEQRIAFAKTVFFTVPMKLWCTKMEDFLLWLQ